MSKKKKNDGPEVRLHPIKLGRKYKDSISGWEGVAAAAHLYLNGCVRIELAGSNDKGEPQGFIFDEEQIVELDDSPVLIRSTHGGPRHSTPPPRQGE